MTQQYVQPDAATLRDMLHAARERTLAHARSLQPEQWLGPYLNIVNPPLWEIGHLAWFQEHWCLRYRPDGTLAPSMLADADARYNSAVVPHAQRWHLALPTADQTLRYLSDVLAAVFARIAHEGVRGVRGVSRHLGYFTQLAVFHEEMHNEAFDYTRQTLGYGPNKVVQKQIVTTRSCSGDATIAGGAFLLGAAGVSHGPHGRQQWRVCCVRGRWRLRAARVVARRRLGVACQG
jgi:iron(II)-dependent oxidoreductase